MIYSDLTSWHGYPSMLLAHFTRSCYPLIFPIFWANLAFDCSPR